MLSLPSRVSGVVVSLAFATAIAHAAPQPQPIRPAGTNPNPVRKDPKLRAPDYGIIGLSYISVSGAAFVPWDSNTVYATTGNGYSQQLLRTATGNFVRFAAPIQLPSGAIVKYLELDYCDTTGGSGFVQGALVEMTYLGNESDYVGFLASNGDGCTLETTDTGDLVVDNFFKHYYLLATVSDNPGDLTGLAGMIVGYQLQVSPPPVNATFNDVPTSHPFFQYIEALFDAGITAGCGSNNYCPDNPVTRGQMAVYLAKALGLSFH
jgi:hypothetical protein